MMKDLLEEQLPSSFGQPALSTSSTFCIEFPRVMCGRVSTFNMLKSSRDSVKTIPDEILMFPDQFVPRSNPVKFNFRFEPRASSHGALYTGLFKTLPPYTQQDPWVTYENYAHAL